MATQREMERAEQMGIYRNEARRLKRECESLKARVKELEGWLKSWVEASNYHKAEIEKLKKDLRDECLLTDRLEKDIKELQMELGNVGHVEADLVEEIEQLKKACERKDGLLEKIKSFLVEQPIRSNYVNMVIAIPELVEEIKKELSESKGEG